MSQKRTSKRLRPPTECSAPIQPGTPMYRMLKAVARAIIADREVETGGDPADGGDTAIKE